MTVGQELSKARRRLGLSLAELSSRTACSVELLQSIEETDLRRLPSGSPLETATRAYAAAVHLDADELTDRYVAQLPILPNTTEAMEAFEPESDAPAQPENTGLFVFASAYDTHPDDAAPVRRTIARSPELTLRSEPDPGAHAAGSPSSVFRSRSHHSAPSRDYRLPVAGLLLASALAVAAGFVVGARRDRAIDLERAALARGVAPSPSPVQQTEPAVEHAVAPGTEAALPVRAGNSTLAAPEETPDAATSTRPDRARATEKAPAAARSAEPTPPAAKRPAPIAEAPVPTAFINVPGSAPAAASPAIATARTAARDEVSGSWDVIAHDESAIPDAATNRVRYYLQLSQRGNRIAGNGYRVSEEGPGATASQRAVAVTGTLSGERLTLNFTGESREHFVLYRAEDGVFRGRFRRDSSPSGGSTIVTLAPRESARQDPE